MGVLIREPCYLGSILGAHDFGKLSDLSYSSSKRLSFRDWRDHPSFITCRTLVSMNEGLVASTS